jgi:hypothetical protein
MSGLMDFILLKDAHFVFLPRFWGFNVSPPFYSKSEEDNSGHTLNMNLRAAAGYFSLSKTKSYDT